MECIIETKAATILEFIQGLHGSVWVAFEEGTSAAWLYDLLKPHVAHLVVCDPRKNALLKAGNKNDRVDARKLSDLLRAGPMAAHRAFPALSVVPAVRLESGEVEKDLRSGLWKADAIFDFC
jgi:hypothetical protein